MSTFEMELVDRLSGPARNAAASIARLDAGLRGLNDQVTRASRQFATLGTSMELAGSRSTRALEGAEKGSRGLSLTAASAFVTVAQGALQAASAVTRLGLSFGQSTIELMSFRDASVAALTTMMGGDAAGAARTFRNAIAIANQSPLDTRPTTEASNALIAGGFAERELAPILAAYADITATRGQQAGDSLVRVFQQMRGLGRVTRGDITMQGITAGVNVGDVFDSIGRQMGMRGSAADIRRQAEAAVAHGRVNDRIAEQAFLDSVRRRYDGGRDLGSQALDQSRTLAGALSNANNAWDNLILSMRSADIPGVNAIRDAVLAITNAMGPNAPIGTALTGIVTDLFNVVGQGLFGGVNERSLNDFASTLQEMRPLIRDVAGGFTSLARGFGSGFMTSIEPLFEAFNVLGGSDGANSVNQMERLGRAIGWLVGAFVWGAAAMGGLAYGLFVWPFLKIYEGLTVLSNARDSATTWLAALPAQMVDGFLGALQTEWQRIISTLDVLAAGLPEPVKRALGIRSPSRVFMALGVDTMRGFEIGLERGGEGVGRTMGDLTTAPEAAIAERFGARSGINLQVNVTVEAREGDEPEEFGRRAGRALADELANLLSILNAGGLAPDAVPS